MRSKQMLTPKDRIEQVKTFQYNVQHNNLRHDVQTTQT